MAVGQMNFDQKTQHQKLITQAAVTITKIYILNEWGCKHTNKQY
jgi:hypothetical protein